MASISVSMNHSDCSTGDKIVEALIVAIRNHVSVLFKICEGVSMLDMVSAFAQLVTSQDYGAERNLFRWCE